MVFYGHRCIVGFFISVWFDIIKYEDFSSISNCLSNSISILTEINVEKLLESVGPKNGSQDLITFNEVFLYLHVIATLRRNRTLKTTC